MHKKILQEFIAGYSGRLISICIVSISLFSCRQNLNSGSELIYWSSSNPEEMSFAKEYIEIWNGLHPNETIIFQPVPEGRSSEEVILAAVVGKTTPDIYANMWQGDVEDYARAGQLVPLDTLEGFMEFMIERCGEKVIEEITSLDGHIYQIPWKVNPIMIVYNKKIFEENGVEDISTFSKFLEAGEKIKSDRNGDGYTDLYIGISEVNAIWWQRFFNFLPLYYASSKGMHLIEEGQAVFDNEHGIKVMDFLQTIYSNDYFPKEQRQGQTDPFLAGKVASRFTGPWAIESIERFKPEGFTYGVMPVPVPDDHEGPVYTYGDPKNIVIFNSCKNPELAWDFVRTMLSEEADLKFLRESRQFPRRQDLTSNPKFSEFLNDNEKLAVFGKQVANLKGIDSAPYMKEVLDLISQEYEACVVYGRKSAEEAMKDAADAVNLLYLD